MNIKSKEKLAILIIVFIITFLGIFQLLSFILIPPNVSINNCSIGNTKKSELPSILKEKKETLEAQKIIIKYEDQKKTYTYKELGIKVNDKKLNEEILNIAKPNIINYFNLLIHGKNIEIPYIFDAKKLDESLKYFSTTKLTKPIDAKYEYCNGEIKIIKEKLGYDFDKEKLLDLLIHKTLKTKEISIPIKKIMPNVTESILKKQGVKELVASFTTYYNLNNESRSTNIHLATKAIDGTLLAPGEVFSFNQTVGERTEEKGYQGAIMYESGKMIEAIGGGICQVSSTLYLASLHGDYQTVERNNHSFTVHYVKLSQDATVAWGTQDFKFKNNTKNHLYIHGEAKNGVVTFELFSTKVPNKNIVLETKILDTQSPPIKQTLDPYMPEGQVKTIKEGITGYTSQLIKHVYINGKLEGSYTQSTDIYRTLPTIIKIGAPKVIKETQQTPENSDLEKQVPLEEIVPETDINVEKKLPSI